MNNFKSPEIWMPCDDMKQLSRINNKYGIIVLNTPIRISCSPSLLGNLWNQAQVRVTVDGGTEKWLQWVEENESKLDNILFPDMITGDMDSLSNDVLHYFTSKNDEIKVVVTPNQDETDFFKALTELSSYCLDKNIKVDSVFVLVDSSGRLDQILANLNTLFKSSKTLCDVRIFLLGSNSLTWLLPKGEHLIHVPSCLRENQEWCALLPIGQSCNVTTTGLKWNLNKDTLAFGGLVSSSNTYDGSHNVYIHTDNPLIWSMSIQSLLAS